MTSDEDRAREEWRSFPLDRRYSISSHGRVRGARGQLLRLWPTWRGYLRWRSGKRSIYRSVHSSVLITFTGPRPEGHEGAHWSGDRLDNRWENLVWLTPGENSRMRAEHGTEPLGEQRPNAKLTSAAVREIRSSTLSGPKLARKYGVNTNTIYKTRNGERWKHVLEPINADD